MWPNATPASQSMPMWMLAPASLRPGSSSSLPRGAPVPTKTASNPLVEQRLQARDGRVVTNLDAHPRIMSISSSSTRARAGGTTGCSCASGRPARRASRRSPPRSRAARGRWPPRATPARRRCRRRACRSSCAGAFGSRSLTSSRRSAATRLRRQIATGFSSIARAPARRLARPIARAPEDAREHVRLAVQHVRVGVPPLRDQPDVLGHVGVRRTRPLAIDDLVEVARIFDVGRLHPWGLRSLRTLDRTSPSRYGKTRKTGPKRAQGRAALPRCLARPT